MDALWYIVMEGRDNEPDQQRASDEPEGHFGTGLSAEDAASLPEGETASLFLDVPIEGSFSPFELRDRVVIMLLFDQVVREEQVELAWQLWRQMSHEGAQTPFWRVLTLFPELDRELIYAEAARVYGFEEARINRQRAIVLIQQLEQRLDAHQWEQMVELRVVPMAEYDPLVTGKPRLIFAVQDPTRPEVHQLLEELDLPGFELRYASEGDILDLLVVSFPHRYNHLMGLSGVSKDFLAGVHAPPAEPAPASVSTDVQPGVVRTIIDLFEEVLAASVRQHATDACVLPTPDGVIEVYFQRGDTLQRWRTVGEPTADVVIRVIRKEVLGLEDCGAGRIHYRVIEREVDGTRYRFRVACVPPSAEVHAECIVVHINQ